MGNQQWREETWTQINDLEQKEEINIQPEQNEETRIQKYESSLKNALGKFKRSNIWIIGVPMEKRKSKKLKTYLKKLMKENQSGKGNKLPGSPGSSESPKEVGPKEEHTKAHHN